MMELQKRGSGWELMEMIFSYPPNIKVVHSRTPKNDPKNSQKMVRDERMLHKKRRNVRRLGCVEEMNRSFCDIKLGREKSRDFSCKNSMMVAYLELGFRCSFEKVFRTGLVLKLEVSPSRCGQHSSISSSTAE